MRNRWSFAASAAAVSTVAVAVSTVAAVVFALVFVSGVAASGVFDDGTEAIDITGVVRRVGSEPLTNLVVTADGVDYIIPDEAEAMFDAHLGKTVRVTGSVRREELETPDGSFMVVRRYLVDPVIVEDG